MYKTVHIKLTASCESFSEVKILTRFEDFTVIFWLSMLLFFWVLMTCRLVGRYYCFEKIYCLHVQGWSSLWVHLVSKPRTTAARLSFSLPWESKISCYGLLCCVGILCRYPSETLTQPKILHCAIIQKTINIFPSVCYSNEFHM